MRYTPLLLLLTLFSCKQEKIKVLWDTYPSGRPRTVYYFNNKDDQERFPYLYIKNGINNTRQPIAYFIEKYYENGKLLSSGLNIDDKKTGCWEYYFDNGRPQARYYYRNGINKDTVYYWYPTGKLKRSLIETDTLQHCWHGIDYLEDGSKAVESNLTKDSLNNWTYNGQWKSWYHNGKPSFEANMKDNWSIGKWSEWDSSGNLHQGIKPVNITL
ncbi:MAG: hypothetical protein JST68_03975 [Bacteroidetes bacterium]|nr:hypothetical protein [Bacteroidota bacterium]